MARNDLGEKKADQFPLAGADLLADDDLRRVGGMGAALVSHLLELLRRPNLVVVGDGLRAEAARRKARQQFGKRNHAVERGFGVEVQVDSVGHGVWVTV